LAAQISVPDADLATDCDVILRVFEKLCDRKDIGKLARLLDGDFAFVIVDLKNNFIYAARDRIGIYPLYASAGLLGPAALMLTSELKGVTHASITHVEQFPPGHTLTLTFDPTTRSMTQVAGWSLRSALMPARC
jgi:asparagine synthetase B (glutamine-hydrolysing)